jgi:hypothetical protein
VVLGSDANLKVIAFGISDKAMAVKVDTIVPSKNKLKHVTVAVSQYFPTNCNPFLLHRYLQKDEQRTAMTSQTGSQ